MKALLSDWPVDRPSDWLSTVNTALTGKEMDRLNTAVNRSQPFGDAQWFTRIVKSLNLQHTLRREGPPAEEQDKGNNDN